MKKLLLSLLGILAIGNGIAQNANCGGGRFNTELFPTVNITKNIAYGLNTTYQNQQQTLKLDIYEPTGDVATLRPLIVLAHGGSFVGGTATDVDMVYLANFYAKRGYVVASINYRLGVSILSLDSVEVMKATVRAMHDMRAAVRFFRKDAATANTYKIDPNLIFVGGSSAGAITALQTAYLNDINEAPTYIANILNSMGGIEGTSGNPGYSSTPQACINLCGAIGKNAWITAGDIPVVSVHGTNDDVVPYGHALIYLQGVVPVTVVDGSGSLHPYAVGLGNNSVLHSYQGAGHVPYTTGTSIVQTYMDTLTNLVTPFIYDIVCTASSITPSLPAQSISLFPNPAADKITLRTELEKGMVTVVDVTGRTLITQAIVAGDNEISVNALPKGIYMVNVVADGKQLTQRLVVE